MVALKRLVIAAAAVLLAACSSGGGSTGGGNSPPPPPPPATVPTGLSGSAPDSTSVRLSWTASSAFTSFHIFRNDVEIATTTSTTYTDTGLSASTAYRYFLRGETATGLSGASSTITVTTPNMLTLSLAQLIDPAAHSYIMVRDVEFDAAGNLFITGGAFSANFPTTAGAYDRTFASGGSSTGTAGPSDAFVMKVSRTGQVIWSTLIGGPNYDRAYALELASDGGVIIAGRAGEGFPTTAGVIQPAFAGDASPNSLYGKQDGFIAKLSADGSALLWSTYLGDAQSGLLRDVAVDGNNKVYVAGAGFADFPHVTANAVQPTARGAFDLVYARLSANASTLEYGTFLGGTEPSGATPGTPSIWVTPGREVYVAIEEGGSGAPTTSNAYQRNNAGGDDFLIARFSATDQLVYATYLGGSGNEDLETHNIAVDGSGRLAIASASASTNYPTTPFAYQPLYGGGSYDGVISILSADGSSLAASTYLGGSGREDFQGVEFAPDGLLYISGGTRSSGLKTTSNAFAANFSGVEDAIIAGFTGDLRGAPYISYFGGSDEDISRALDIASDGAIAFGGHTVSPNFPVAAGGSTAPNGAYTGWFSVLTP